MAHDCRSREDTKAAIAASSAARRSPTSWVAPTWQLAVQDVARLVIPGSESSVCEQGSRIVPARLILPQRDGGASHVARRSGDRGWNVEGGTQQRQPQRGHQDPQFRRPDLPRYREEVVPGTGRAGEQGTFLRIKPRRRRFGCAISSSHCPH